MNSLIYKTRLFLIKTNIKKFSTSATSSSGSTQNEGNRKLLELSLQAFSSTIMPAIGIYYLHTVLKEDTNTKVQSNDSLIKANKETAEKEIKAIKDLINANKEMVEKEINANKDLINANKEMVEKKINAIKDLINANKDLINANKEMVEKEIKANKETSIEMIKAYGANIENLILKKG